MCPNIDPKIISTTERIRFLSNGSFIVGVDVDFDLINFVSQKKIDKGQLFASSAD